MSKKIGYEEINKVVENSYYARHMEEFRGHDEYLKDDIDSMTYFLMEYAEDIDSAKKMMGDLEDLIINILW